MRRAAKVAALGLASTIIPQTFYGQASSVELWITSSDEAGVVAGLEAQPGLFFGADADDVTAAIKVDDGKVYQRMEGGSAAYRRRGLAHQPKDVGGTAGPGHAEAS